jgi:hypothetical protein
MHGHTSESNLIRPRRRHSTSHESGRLGNRDSLVVAALPNVQAPSPQSPAGARRIFDEAHRPSNPTAEAVSPQIDAAPITRDWFRVSSGILISALLLYLAFHSLTEVGRIQKQQVDAVPTQELEVPLATQDQLAVAAPLHESQLGLNTQDDQDLVDEADPAEPLPAEAVPLEMPPENSLSELPEYPVTGFPELAEDSTQAMELAAEMPRAPALPDPEPALEWPIMPPTESIERDSPRLAQRPDAIPMSDAFQQFPVESQFDLKLETATPTVTAPTNPAQLRGTIEKFPVTN